MTIKLHALVSGTQLEERQDKVNVRDMIIMAKLQKRNKAQEDTMTTTDVPYTVWEQKYSVGLCVKWMLFINVLQLKDI